MMKIFKLLKVIQCCFKLCATKQMMLLNHKSHNHLTKLLKILELSLMAIEILLTTCTQVKSMKHQTERSYCLFHFYLLKELNYQSQSSVKKSMPFSLNYMVKTGITMSVLISIQRRRLLNSTMRISLTSIFLKVLIHQVHHSKNKLKLLTCSLEHKWSNMRITKKHSGNSCQFLELLTKKRLRSSYISLTIKVDNRTQLIKDQMILLIRLALMISKKDLLKLVKKQTLPLRIPTNIMKIP